MYLELAHLLEAGVVVKGRGLFELSIPWVCRFTEFADGLGDIFFARERQLVSLPKSGESLQVTFHSSYRSDAFWMQSVLAVLAKDSERRLFQWLPHPWHHLTQGSKSNFFETALRKLKARDYVIIGGDTFLDRQASKSWSQDVFSFSHARSLFHTNMTEPGSVVGDFVIRTVYSVRFMNEVDRYYSRIKKASDVIASDVIALFGQKMKLTVKIEHNPAKAKRLKGRFLRYFGVR